MRHLLFRRTPSSLRRFHSWISHMDESQTNSEATYHVEVRAEERIMSFLHFTTAKDAQNELCSQNLNLQLFFTTRFALASSGPHLSPPCYLGYQLDRRRWQGRYEFGKQLERRGWLLECQHCIRRGHGMWQNIGEFVYIFWTNEGHSTSLSLPLMCQKDSILKYFLFEST